MAEITFEWDSRELSVFRDAKVERALAQALSKAGGDAIRFMRTGASRLIRQRKRIKVQRVNRSLVLRYPTSRAIENLVWTMDVAGDPMPLGDYPVRQTKQGVRVEVNRGRTKLLKSAFIATMKSGHRGVFRRRGKSRLPIDELFSTRVSDVFRDKGFVPFIQAGGQVRFDSAFRRLFELELSR